MLGSAGSRECQGASAVAACWLSSCGSQNLALVHRPRSYGPGTQLLHGMWDVPDPGIKPVSPALAVGFFNTEPPRKSQNVNLIVYIFFKSDNAEYIIRNTGLEEAQAGIKIAGRNINNLRYADDTTLMAESEELKSLLMKVKEESEKADLKLNIQKMKIMASGPITSWEIDGETVETVADFIFLCSKITADGNCSHEIKRRLTPWKKNYDQPIKT